MQIVNLIIDRYLTAVPEWVIEDMLKKGILKFTGGFDKYQFLSAAQKGARLNVATNNSQLSAPPFAH